MRFDYADYNRGIVTRNDSGKATNEDDCQTLRTSMTKHRIRRKWLFIHSLTAVKRDFLETQYYALQRTSLNAGKDSWYNAEYGTEDHILSSSLAKPTYAENVTNNERFFSLGIISTPQLTNSNGDSNLQTPRYYQEDERLISSVINSHLEHYAIGSSVTGFTSGGRIRTSQMKGLLEPFSDFLCPQAYPTASGGKINRAPTRKVLLFVRYCVMLHKLLITDPSHLPVSNHSSTQQ
ncbi:hypothetical protein CSKR_107048 [Clonorchis sinensis]|uniref:Uncharacterized protein n=1 Tax=Clonorchis sinensis TaxID=79923 RepID=A0A419PD89_CLOSI|nr:hypothetical protein CSKR_107048 [Clonorchis sinensis]